MLPESPIEIAQQVRPRLGLVWPIRIDAKPGQELEMLTLTARVYGVYYNKSLWDDGRHYVIVHDKAPGKLLRHILAHELTHALQAERAIQKGQAYSEMVDEMFLPAPDRAYELRDHLGRGGQWSQNIGEWEAWTRARELSAELWGEDHSIPEWHIELVQGLSHEPA